MTMHDDYFGLCPICHKTDGYLNIGRGHWFFCKEHKKTWCVGSNLFSCWRDQTEQEQRQYYDEVGMAEFEKVEPYFHPQSRDEQITEQLRHVLGDYFRAHPEICGIKLRCYGEDGGLLNDLLFSPPAQPLPLKDDEVPF